MKSLTPFHLLVLVGSWFAAGEGANRRSTRMYQQGRGHVTTVPKSDIVMSCLDTILTMEVSEQIRNCVQYFL